MLGTGSTDKGLAGRLVYVMQVAEILTFDDYWKDPRFARKVPTDQGAVKRAYGDNIYRHGDDGTWLQADSRHSLADGKPNPGHIKVDTSVDAVLVARRFSYFGGGGPTIPTSRATTASCSRACKASRRGGCRLRRRSSSSRRR